MARNIDADELKKGIEQQFCTACDSRNGVRCSACDVADCLMYIDDAPTIEANNAKAAAIMQHYGAKHQLLKLAEECAELIQAVEKSRRQPDAPELTADMVEEMADVYIMIMQFESIMGLYWSGVFDRTVEDKLVRQLERIESEEG